MDTIATDRPLPEQTYFNSSFLHPLVYIACAVEADKEGIFVYRLNAATGELVHVQSVTGGEKPSYLEIDSHRRYLYAVNKDNDGAVLAYEIDQKSGFLKFLNKQPCPGGPAHVITDHFSRVVLVANYAGGTIAVFPIQENGHLGPASYTKEHKGSSVNKQRQDKPHPHFITPDPTNKYVFVADLGLDKVVGYVLDSDKGTLTLNEPVEMFNSKPGSGPRHIVFHPNGNYAYLIHELGSIVTVLFYNKQNGTFTELQTIPTIPSTFTEENLCAAIHILPNGRFLFGSNRGHDSIVVYAIEPDTGKLSLVEHFPSGGKSPRDFTIDLTGNILIVANEESNNVLTYRINEQTGTVTETGFKYEFTKARCLKVIPDFAD